MSSSGDGEGHASAIAIVGVSGRFPGARDVNAFWQNVRDGVESIRFFTREELLASGESEEALDDSSYVRAYGKLDDIDQFDAALFGMSPIDAAVFDPQHRLFLECAWEAFESAGHIPGKAKGPVGVFATAGMLSYFVYNLVRNRSVMTTMGDWLVRHTGNDSNFLATRVSYEFDLHGPSVTVQTACSSSLVAVHMACQSLLSGECDMALAGGSMVASQQGRGYFYNQGEILSPDGHCRPFDARAQGTVMASAVGCVILKRLDDAERDGDDVFAILRGSAINNDGSDKVGYLAPSVTGQARVIAEALAVSGVHPDDVSYVEAHGTATLLGDPIEVAGLTQAFRAQTERQEYCAIGSVKSNIGHAGEAAGIAALLKTVMALRHRVLPKSLHFDANNPRAELESSPFFVNRESRAWTLPLGKKRIAGVTSLGAGGTNAHVLLEEAPARSAGDKGRAYQLLTLSANSERALATAARNLAHHLRETTEVHLADVAFSLLGGRKGLPFRQICVADAPSAAAELLEREDGRGVFRRQVCAETPSLVFMFPGGGAQYPAMGRDLYESESAYREAFDECIRLAPPAVSLHLRSLVQPKKLETTSELLESPSLALPALFATEYAMAKLLLAWGLEPDAMIGHSAGEYTAACLAGVITCQEGLALVYKRGQLFETLPEGGMLSIALAPGELAPLLSPELSIAAVNGPSSCVASGPLADIERLERTLSEREIDCARVRIRVAAHSSMLEPVLAEFEAFCRTIRFRPPTRRFISNLTGDWTDDSQATQPRYWVDHLRKTVLFQDGLARLLSRPCALLEVGPGRTLTNFASAAGPAHLALSSMRHAQETTSDLPFLLESVGKLWTFGVPLDEARLYAGQQRLRVQLPPYPFDRQRHWIDPDEAESAGKSTGALRKRADVTDWFATPGWAVLPPARPMPASAVGHWLIFGDESSLTRRLVDVVHAAGGHATVVLPGERFGMIEPGFTLRIDRRDDYQAIFAELQRRKSLPTRIVHLWGAEGASFPSPVSARTVSSALRKVPLGKLLPDPLASYESHLARHFYSLVLLLQVAGSELDEARLLIATTDLLQPSAKRLMPEKALSLGVGRVLAREYPQFEVSTVDLPSPRTSGQVREAAERILAEACSPALERTVSYRDGVRSAERLLPVRIPPADEAGWMRTGGVYLVTGGMGAIGMQVARHLAAKAQARLILLGHSPLPDEREWDTWLRTHDPADPTSRRVLDIQELRRTGAEVLPVYADLSDARAVLAAIDAGRARFGRIEGVFHAAGILKDELIALRSSEPRSQVIDVKVKGALLLDAILAPAPPDFVVLFSSVSAVLGLPGQVDYTAANCFLDAFARERSHSTATRYLSIDWNAWKEVGMLVALGAPRPVTTSTSLWGTLTEQGEELLCSLPMRRGEQWMLDEHVVKGGEAVLPGTGYLELACAMVHAHARSGSSPLTEASVPTRAIEVRDLFFLSPLVVASGTTQTLCITHEARTGQMVFWSTSQERPHATCLARSLAVPEVPPWSLSDIRQRCNVSHERVGGALPQHFMDFGPRWSCLSEVFTGHGEALLRLVLPPSFKSDVNDRWLHPALLDLATGGAQHLQKSFDPQKSFYVPLSYERVLVRRRMPAQLWSHVRLRDATRAGEDDVAVFDVSLLDDEGNLLVEIQGFLMKRVDSALFAPKQASAPAPRQGAEVRAERSPSIPPRPQLNAAMQAALRNGMTNAEGLSALDRLMAYPLGPQVIASTVDLDVWLEQLAGAARELGGGSLASVPRRADRVGEPLHDEDRDPPRDRIERELAELWTELLGVARVGSNDDFFELGGQSLIAVRLFNRIRKKFGVELSLATLFEAPTIGQCAVVLREQLGIAAPAGDQASAGGGATSAGDTPAGPAVTRPAYHHLVTIQSGNPQRLPFFMVHGAGGNVLNFRDLGRGLDSSQPFFGIQASGVDGTSRPCTRIEEMATRYLAEVQTAQPVGPYLLGGYSGGGVVAFEMARQLTQAGEKVALMAFIDTFHPQMPLREGTLQTRLSHLREEGIAYLRGGAQRRLLALRQKADLLRIERLVRAGETIPYALRELHVMHAFGMAAQRYRPETWEGHGMLFRAEQLSYIFGDAGPAYGWDQHLRGGLDVVSVPGNHEDLLLGPNAAVLLRSLSNEIQRIQETAGRVPRP